MLDSNSSVMYLLGISHIKISYIYRIKIKRPIEMQKINSFQEYEDQYKKSIENPSLFWEEIAQTFKWKKKWNRVLDWDFNKPKVSWFEGVPSYPDYGRFWEIIDKHKVSIFYTAPTAIRALEAQGLDFVTPYKLDSLKVLGTVGEPINEEAWQWYHTYIGKEKCPIVDTWWQTETGGMMIAPLAGITKLKPTYATLPLPGVQPCLVDEKGNEMEGLDVEGNLCIKYPWPSMIRTTYGDHNRCKEVYFSAYPGKYFTGDGCRRDADGFYRITGRVDDVINVSGHRIGTAEVEDAINQHEEVVESAVVGFPHSIKGQGIYAFVILSKNEFNPNDLCSQIHELVKKHIGPIARPEQIQFVSGLPKTRSGKIMRRILRKIASGEINNFGDTSTLLDPEVVDAIVDSRNLIIQSK